MARARLKEQIAAGAMTAGEVILRSGWEIDTMPIDALLLSQRGWGERRCRHFLARVRIRESKTIGSLTERQRLMLSAILADHENRSVRVPRDDPSERPR